MSSHGSVIHQCDVSGKNLCQIRNFWLCIRQVIKQWLIQKWSGPGVTEWSEPTTWRLGHSEGGLGGCGRGMFPLLELSAKAKDILDAKHQAGMPYEHKVCTVFIIHPRPPLDQPLIKPGMHGKRNEKRTGPS